ncbi:MAG: hypothetical protein M0P12_00635 [Paludibacteraceae bacterium]|nr:hypothetical protein [Paludibacteraceae bacterium]MCK9615603.1 hypothetical protein [Candidatus Omnitrophota bacterium]
MAKEIKAKPTRFENMQKLADLINKSQWGGENHDIAGVLGGTVVSNVERISTTNRDIDWAWGGGLPIGKIIELFGGESCLDKDTFIKFQTWKDGRQINEKGGTIERLYERFTGDITVGRKQGRHLQEKDCDFFVISCDHEGKMIHNKVVGVVKTGKKPCFEVVTEDGQKITSTLEHKFMVDSGFKPLSDLKIGDLVYVHNNTRTHGQKDHEYYPEILVKYHPHAKTKIINGYTYYRVKISHAVLEADRNQMSFDEYRDFLNVASKEEIDKIKTIPEGLHVHHIDENVNNNTASNLLVINSKDHGVYHSKMKLKNLSFIAAKTKITSIINVGERETYDIKCDFPNNNFVANNFIVHNSGKSTLAYHIIASFQENYPEKGILLLDTEHSYDPLYAEALGVKAQGIIHTEAETGTDALNIAKLAAESDCGIGLIIIDSIAALTTKSDDNGDIGDQTMAEQARMVSQAMRVLNSLITKHNITLLCTNQVREAVGQCFDYSTPITLKDGTIMEIGKLVNQKINCEVLSYDPVSNKIEPKTVTNWFDNGPMADGEHFLQFKLSTLCGFGKGGIRKINVTPNHIIFVPHGEKMASEIKPGESVLIPEWSYYSKDQHEIILGSMFGDGNLRYDKGSPRGTLRFIHCQEQTDYCSWKAESFGEEVRFDIRGRPQFETKSSSEFDQYKDFGKKQFPREISQEHIDNLSPKSFAIWYMDDGNFSGSHEKIGFGKCRIGSSSIIGRDLEKIAIKSEELGLGLPMFKEGVGLVWYGEQSGMFQRGISKYVHPNMRYKIKKGMPDFDWTVERKEKELVPVARTVQSVSVYVPPKRQRNKFDIEVDGNHSYIAGGMIVHNSYGDKTTTPAGKALRHYAHIRAKLSRIGQIKVGEAVVGVKVKMSCIKNKVAPPFRNAEYTITFGIGIDSVIGCVEKAISLGIIVKKGGWFSFNGKTWQGQQTVVDEVRGNADLRKEINAAIDSISDSPDKREGTEMTEEEKKEIVSEEEKDDANISVV